MNQFFMHNAGHATASNLTIGFQVFAASSCKMADRMLKTKTDF
jgi:hypothetical protein